MKRLLPFLLAGSAWAIPEPQNLDSRVAPAPPALMAPATTARLLPSPPAVKPTAVEKVQLTYENAPLIALAKNPTVTAGIASVREYMAKAEVTASAQRFQGKLGLQGPPIAPSNGSFRNDYVLSPVSIEMRQLIFEGGKIRFAVEQGKHLARSQAWQAQSDWQELYYEVRKAYLNTLARQGDLRLAEQQVELTQQQLRQAEVRFQVGKAPRGDVLSAKLPVSQAQVTVAKRLAAYQKSLQELNQLMGLALTTPLELEAPKLPEGPLPDVEACVKEALDQRPVLWSLTEQLVASMKQIRAGEADNAPQINLLLGIAGISQGTQVIGAAQYRGGFEVNWFFADGGRAAHLGEVGRAVRDKNYALLEEKRRVVELEVRDAYRDLQLGVETHQSEELRVAQARDALRIAQAQYRAGLINVYPVRQAQTDLFEAQQAEVQAFYDYFLALAKLDLACGRSGGTKVDTPWAEED
ncbi:MAG: TolC family protein [Candidatus Eremiobacteraeota bacterium]|nr:TolC family protein [Candidatus Eremiobacteraeota bacterium]